MKGATSKGCWIEEHQEGDVLVQEARDLPDMRDLKRRVDEVVASSTWWERYGIDWFVVCVSAALLPQCVQLVASNEWWYILTGMFFYGCIHAVLVDKAGHAATHDGMCANPRFSRFWSKFFIEFVGSFSDTCARELHVGGHHPYTNIIGLGDSTVWKAPFLGRFMYMLVAPMALHLFTSLFAVSMLLHRPRELASFLLVAGSGILLQLSVLVHYCGYSWLMAFVVLFVGRGIMGVPYIHINIFQHIGQHMWTKDRRPPRILQMSDGVLNLHRNPILDWCFGHALISCHVEHHLFPKLSDNMCLKVKPVVRSFLKESGLPYHEDSYMNRFEVFWRNYDEYMRQAPPITHFIGLQ